MVFKTATVLVSTELRASIRETQHSVHVFHITHKYCTRKLVLNSLFISRRFFRLLLVLDCTFPSISDVRRVSDDVWFCCRPGPLLFPITSGSVRDNVRPVRNSNRSDNIGLCLRRAPAMNRTDEWLLRRSPTSEVFGVLRHLLFFFGAAGIEP